jgi:hypothetical protein
MNSDDVAYLIIWSAFGVWCLLSPRSYVRVFTWYSPGRKFPKPFTIRIFGLVWIILVVSRSLWHIHHRSVITPEPTRPANGAVVAVSLKFATGERLLDETR